MVVGEDDEPVPPGTIGDWPYRPCWPVPSSVLRLPCATDRWPPPVEEEGG